MRADDKKRARLNVIRDLLSRVKCPDVDQHRGVPDPNVVFVYAAANAGRLAP